MARQFSMVWAALVGVREALIAALALVASMASLLVAGRAHLADANARAGIETAITMWTLLAAGLLLRQFTWTGLRRDLLLFVALGIVSLSDFSFCALPALVGFDGDPSAGLQLQAGVLVAAAFAAAAWAPRGRVPEEHRRRVTLLAFAGLAVFGCVELSDSPMTPNPPLDFLRYLGSDGSAPRAALLALAVAATALFLVAGVGFIARRRGRHQDGGVLAAASFLLAVAKLQYLWVATLPFDWVTLHEILRLGAYALLLAVAVAEQVRLARQAAHVGIRTERERIARDLHDGLAQDLAVIAMYARRLEQELGIEHPLAIAARHALAVARGKMVDLAASSAPTTFGALKQVAAEVSGRYGITVEITAEPALSGEGDFGAADREEIVRIAREAIVNAARHGGASRVRVELGSGAKGWLLRVVDNGSGIGHVVTSSGGLSGFGLPTMRARAKSIGARVVTRASDSGGTSLEVLIR